jgi:hypothetical protein
MLNTNDPKEQQIVHKARAEYKAKFIAERFEVDEEDLKELGIHLKQRSRA